MIKPERVTLTTISGKEKNFVLSKVPAIQAREIALQYPTSALPKIGDYKINEQLMFKLLRYVGVELSDGNVMLLDTPEKINNHVEEWEDLIKLEGMMVAYNFSFFRDGKGLTSLSGFVQTLKPLITEMLTDILRRSSMTEKQPSEN